MVILCWALLASFIAGYYWFEYTDFTNRVGGIPITVNIGVNYGNLTTTQGNNTLPFATKWNNDTQALTGMTLFKATEDVANLTYDTMAGYGVYVKSINGTAETGTYGWVWWLWSSQGWTLGPISSGAYAISQGETFMWYYESGQTWPPPSPP